MRASYQSRRAKVSSGPALQIDIQKAEHSRQVARHQQRRSRTPVWVRTDAVEHALNGTAPVPGKTATRKRSRRSSSPNSGAEKWGWVRAYLLPPETPPSGPIARAGAGDAQSPERGSPSKGEASPFGRVRLRKTPPSSPANQFSTPAVARRTKPAITTPVLDRRIPLSLVVDDHTFAPDHLNGATVTLPPTVEASKAEEDGDVLMANHWWTPSPPITPSLARTQISNPHHPPDDLTILTHLHEPSVVLCLKARYEEDLIYTYTGPILLALNPFRRCNGLYGEDVMKEYWKKGEGVEKGRGKPHVYAIADDAFRNMMRLAEIADPEINAGDDENGSAGDQSILVSGESGAGKTVTTKIIMRYLATLSQRSHNRPEPPVSSLQRRVIEHKSIESQVLQSNPILESFGNARTIRNDNSSRFGKFIEIRFDTSSGCLLSAAIDTYLLEKVRLITQASGERNYHIFYELLAGASRKERRELGLSERDTAQSFRMTSNSGTFDRRDGVKDTDTYKDLRTALDTVGFTGKETSDVLTVVVALLHISNVTFQEPSPDESALDPSNMSLQSACDIMGVSREVLNDALTTTAIEAGRGEKLTKKLCVSRAEKALEAFIKATYGSLFSHIVDQVNSSITVQDTGGPGQESDARGPHIVGRVNFIGVLDIFGFESFDINSFEQLCINYCNEALQQQFNRFVFKLEQEEYEREGIEWSFISFPDNQDVLDLIDTKHTGILSILDEQCRLAKCTDVSFARATYEKCSPSLRFNATDTQKVSGSFSVVHYAGPVEYITQSFVEKNKDELPKESTDLLSSSNHPLLPVLGRRLSNQIPAASRPTSRPTSPENLNTSQRQFKRSSSSSLTRPTVGSQFASQLQQLRARIDRTSPHYVRCLKPNDDLVPHAFDPLVIADQLRCAGVLEAVRVSRVGFPQRYVHGAFLSRYRLLALKVLEGMRADIEGDRGLCNVLVGAVAENVREVQRVEKLREGGVFGEEEASVQSDDTISVGIQMGKTKVFLRRKAFDALEQLRSKKIDSAAVRIQTAGRRHTAQSWFIITLGAVIVIQSCIRGCIATCRVRELRWNRSAILIESAWRRFVDEKTFRAVKLIVEWTQSYYRGNIGRAQFVSLNREQKATVVQSYWRRRYFWIRFALLRNLAVNLQCAFRARVAREVYRKLRREARDLGLVAAERDELRREADRMRREMEDAKKKASKNLGFATFLATKCAQKDREIDLLRKELDVLKGGRKSESNSVSFRSMLSRSFHQTSKPARTHAQRQDQPCSVLREGPDRMSAGGQNTFSAGLLTPFQNFLGGGDDATALPAAVPNIPDRMAVQDETSFISSPRQHGSTWSESSSNLLDNEVLGDGKKCLHQHDCDNVSHLNEVETGGSGPQNTFVETPFHAAVRADSALDLTIALRSSTDVHFDINRGDSHGRTPLHIAALTSNLRLIQFLLANHAVANTQDHKGNTPLHLALDAEVIECLLCVGGANPNIPNCEGLTVLHCTTQRRDLAAVECLLKHHADVNAADDSRWYTSLHLIAQGDRYRHLPDSTPNPSSRGSASLCGQIARALCRAKVPAEPDLNYQDRDGNTPLHHVAVLSNGDELHDLLSLFLDSGGDPAVQNQRGQTPLHLLCHNRSARNFSWFQETLHYVLFHGGDPNASSLNGCTALHLALYHKDIDSAVQLVQHGAELHLPWRKPARWETFWDVADADAVLALDMVEDDLSRHRILSAVTNPQSRAPSRPRCMSCRSSFSGAFGRRQHYCCRCGSLICGECSPHNINLDLFPKPFRDIKLINESSIRVCIICEKILLSRADDDSSETQPTTCCMEDDEERAHSSVWSYIPSIALPPK